MSGRIDHIIITVNNFENACRFYNWLMPQLGYSAGVHDFDGTRGWTAETGSFWIKTADTRFSSDTFSKDRVGLCEIAFQGESRAQIDALAKELASHGGRILDLPREYDYAPGYYAVFFTDPDGIKLEIVHTPSV